MRSSASQTRTQNFAEANIMKLGLAHKTKSAKSTPLLHKSAAPSEEPIRLSKGPRGRRRSVSPLPKKSIVLLSIGTRSKPTESQAALLTVLPRPQSRTGSVHTGIDQEFEALLMEISQMESSLTVGKHSLAEKRWVSHRRSEALPRRLPTSSNSPPHSKSPYGDTDDRQTRTPGFGVATASHKLLKGKRKKSLQSLKVTVAKEGLDVAPGGLDGYSGHRLKPAGGYSLESSTGRRSTRSKQVFDLSVNPAKRGIRRFEKVQTEARDYLDKLEDVMQEIRRNRGKLLMS